LLQSGHHRWKDGYPVRGKTGERQTRSRREAISNLSLPISHQKLAKRMGYRRTVRWVEEHPDEYARGISHGFEASE
jgi:hypothetical protein